MVSCDVGPTILTSARVTGIALLVSLGLLIAGSSTAVASSRTRPTLPAGFPNCATLSRTSLASLGGTGPLAVLKITGPLCTFIGRVAGHYRPTLEVEIVPYSTPLWHAATAVHPPHATTGYSSPKLFFWTQMVTSETQGNTSPCQPDDVVENETAPACSGQPDGDAFGVSGHGPYKSGSLEVIVTVGLTGQQGDVHLSHALALVTQILSGKIH
jgi:hypothetical protein